MYIPARYHNNHCQVLRHVYQGRLLLFPQLNKRLLGILLLGVRRNDDCQEAWRWGIINRHIKEKVPNDYKASHDCLPR